MDELQKSEPTHVVPQAPLEILKTQEDKYGQDIAKMSDFLGGCIQLQTDLFQQKQSPLAFFSQLPAADFGIVSELIRQAISSARKGPVLLPDFDSLSTSIQEKLKAGVFTLKKSKQVEGNFCPVIYDENNVRVKDVTLKQVSGGNVDLQALQNLATQVQLRQIYTALQETKALVSYQIDSDRNHRLIVPFLDARDLIVAAQAEPLAQRRTQLLQEADRKMKTAWNEALSDLKTTAEHFAKATLCHRWDSNIDDFINYLTDDIQLIRQYLGLRLQILAHLDNPQAALDVYRQWQKSMQDFLTQPITAKDRLSAATLLHDYFPYKDENRDLWYYFSRDLQPALAAGEELLALNIDAPIQDAPYTLPEEESTDGT